MIKVAHIVNSNIYSGLENVVCTIIDEMKTNYEMIYVTKNGPIVEVLKEKNIPYCIIEKMSIREINKFIKEWKPDIIHSHDFTPSLISSFTSKKIPKIIHIHQNPTWLKKINLKSFIFLFSGLRANKIITVSPAIKDEFIFSRQISTKIECLYNPIGVSKITSKVTSDNCQEKKYDICCIGRVTDVKNPYLFVDVIEEVCKRKDNIKAVWVGDGDQKENIEKIIASKNLQNNIEFIGFKENPYNYCNYSKIFLLCSKWEGFGLSAFEALALGVPCVVSNVGGLVNIVDESCGKLCNTKKDYIEEIIDLLDHDDELKRKSINASKKAKKIENFEEYFIKLDKIYKEVGEEYE